MKKVLIPILCCTIILAFLIFSKNSSPVSQNNPQTPKEDKLEEEIKDQLNNLTLEEKIGQMFFIAYRKPTMDAELTNILNTIKPGGFILFSENITNFENTTNLVHQIKQSNSIPLFIGIDQEGGKVARLKTIPGLEVHEIEPMQNIGATNDLNLAYTTGVTIAQDLQKIGVNLDFAPVLDVYQKASFLETRCFSDNPTIVNNMGLKVAEGLIANNIIPVFKHFPGHGNTQTNSHDALPVVEKTKEELLNNDLIPFMNAIKNDAQIIMIGHLAVPSLTNDSTPASLSKTIITDLLRKELGYQNIVITDALNMKAITDNYSNDEIYEMAINAGVDLLLMPEDPLTAFNTIKKLINEGKISEEEINNSVLKILKLKAKYLN